MRRRGAVINLSSKGCKVESEASVKVGDAMSLIILLPGQPAPASIDLALVRWAKGDCFGLEFISITPADAKRLQEFLVSADPHDR
ncbi:MAG: PilZ domain-containing protein [Nitrospiraceae bacterium]